MKRAYTQLPINAEVRRRLKGVRTLGEAAVLGCRLGERVEKLSGQVLTEHERRIELHLWLLRWRFANRAGVRHLFLPSKEFCDWLVECAGETSGEVAAVLEGLLGDDSWGELHFPVCAKIAPCAFFCVELEQDHQARLFTWLGDNRLPGADHQWITLDGRSVKDALEQLKTHSRWEASPQLDYATRLLVGLGLYLQAFPEQLKPGLPEDAKHPSWFKGDKNYSVGMSPKVRVSHGTHASPIAHFRSGHFRVLRAERFTNKRGQVIFIPSCFVAGKASTVVAPGD